MHDIESLRKVKLLYEKLHDELLEQEDYYAAGWVQGDINKLIRILDPLGVTNPFVFEWLGYGEIPSQCIIEIFGNLVIATHMPNRGTSITNDAEGVATAVCNKYSIEPDKLIWIEHYIENGIGEETYDFVKFEYKSGRFTNPNWERTTKEDVERLIKRL